MPGSSQQVGKLICFGCRSVIQGVPEFPNPEKIRIYCVGCVASTIPSPDGPPGNPVIVSHRDGSAQISISLTGVVDDPTLQRLFGKVSVIAITALNRQRERWMCERRKPRRYQRTRLD